MQLRHKFFLILTLLTTVPLLILLFGVVDQLESEIRSRTEKELHVTLDKMASELMLIIDNQQAIARGLAQDPTLRQFANLVVNPSGKRISPTQYRLHAEALEEFFLNYQKAVPDIQALRFMDRNGKTLVKVKEGKPIEAKQFDDDYRRLVVSDQSDKSFFKDAIAGQQDVVMSDFELGQLTGDADFCPAMVRYTTRIKDEVDETNGLLVVNMWGSRLDSAIEASLGGYPGRAMLVEVNQGSPRDGIYLYHRDSRQRFADQMHSDYRFQNEVSPQEWQTIASAKKDGTLFHDDGTMYFYHSLAPFVTRPEVKWLLIIKADSNVIMQPIHDMRHSIWLLLGLLIIVSLIISVWAAWRLTRPVHALADAITRYADGDTSSHYSEKGKDEISHAGNAFNYLTNNLKQAEQARDKAEKIAYQAERLASIGQLAAGIGHEINNPLMNILSLAALIETEVKEKNPEAIMDIQLLQKEGKRCARIVQGILNFARETQPAFREFNMTDLIADTLRLLQHRLSTSAIQLITEIEADMVMVGDASQLQQVLVNILLNAVQASPAGGVMSIMARKDIDYIAIQITDSGTGIDQKNIGRVFDPFFTTKADDNGTGLGLSVSYGIVKRHGGTIHLDNNVGLGLNVMILLPIQIQEISAHHQLEAEDTNVA
jgi:two-component system NtrC family sensor kinase